jgi:hypothetical protein
LGAFLIGFFGGNPFALGNLPEFLGGLATVLHHYGTEQPGFEGSANWRWYPGVFLTSADALWTVAGAIGLLGILIKEWKTGLLLLCFPVLYYLMVSRFVVRFERNMVPLLPFLAIGAGWLIDKAAGVLARRFQRTQLWSGAIAAFGVVLLIGPSLIASSLFDSALSKTDHREVAGRWVEQNIEPGSKIAIEHYSIPFNQDEYQIRDVLRASDHDLAWYKQEGFDYLIVSDGVWEVLREEPELYAEKLDTLDEITGSSELLQEYVPDPPGIVVAGYPTVEVYHFAPVRIYRLPQ